LGPGRSIRRRAEKYLGSNEKREDDARAAVHETQSPLNLPSPWSGKTAFLDVFHMDASFLLCFADWSIVHSAVGIGYLIQ
jgi:hypothetical protein